jgi:hypothetical protein
MGSAPGARKNGNTGILFWSIKPDGSNILFEKE